MRIDKYLSDATDLSRSEIRNAARAGRIRINEQIQKDVSVHIDEICDTVTLDGEKVRYNRYTYIMLNKPAGYLSATEDKEGKTVLELLPPEMKKRGLFPCGRLDIDTTGLLIITDNGQTAHRLLSPKHHAEKEYEFYLRDPLGRIAELEAGVYIPGGYKTKKCRIVADDTDIRKGRIVLTEGRYHQIKYMFSSLGNEITALKRICFAGVPLDEALKPGEWRYLNNEEINKLEEY